jgi:hypothetical protein
MLSFSVRLRQPLPELHFIGKTVYMIIITSQGKTGKKHTEKGKDTEEQKE